MNPGHTFNSGMYADKEVADSWNSWVEHFDKDDTRYEYIYPYISKRIAECKPNKILEIGSGQGVCSEKLDLQGAKYIGVEPSRYLRDIAQKKYPHRSFIPGQAEKMSVDPNSIDMVFSVFVWLHISDLDMAARELRRVLKSNGTFIIVTANPDRYDLWRSWHTNVRQEGKRIIGDMKRLPRHEMYLHSTEEIESSLENNGLHITDRIRCGRTSRPEEAGFTLMLAGNKI